MKVSNCFEDFGQLYKSRSLQWSSDKRMFNNSDCQTSGVGIQCASEGLGTSQVSKKAPICQSIQILKHFSNRTVVFLDERLPGNVGAALVNVTDDDYRSIDRDQTDRQSQVSILKGGQILQLLFEFSSKGLEMSLFWVQKRQQFRHK